jgi:hypothetical protein
VFVNGKVLPLRNFELIARLKPGEPNTSTLLDPETCPKPTPPTRTNAQTRTATRSLDSRKVRPYGSGETLSIFSLGR